MPKSSAHSRRTIDNIDKLDTSDRETPSWDTSPNTFPKYYLELEEWLPKQNARYIYYIRYGYATAGSKTFYCSVNHIDRHRQGLLTKGTFQNPTVVLPSDTVAVPNLPTSEDALKVLRAGAEPGYEHKSRSSTPT